MKGTIVKQSLENTDFLKKIKILKERITDDKKPEDRWNLLTVEIKEEQIEELKKRIKEKWYTHFWNEKELIIVFKNKIFKFKRGDNLQKAIDYGIKEGIPKEQLDFIID